MTNPTESNLLSRENFFIYIKIIWNPDMRAFALSAPSA